MEETKDTTDRMVETLAEIKKDQTSSRLIPYTTYNFSFSGNGPEFFKIWITNIAFTILTLGVYSAWATVRTRRYFYANTRLADRPFSYLADPITILKGRSFALIVAGVLFIPSYFYPAFLFVSIILTLLLLPFLFIRSLGFHRQNSEYRGIRFRFGGGFWHACRIAYLWPLLVNLTASILFPLYKVKLGKFTIGESYFGKTQMGFSADYSDYFAANFLPGLLGLGGFFLVIFGDIEVELWKSLLFWFLGSGCILMALLLWKYLNTQVLYSNIVIGKHKVKTKFNFIAYSKVALSNYILIVLTLGLFYPVARIRLAKYFSGLTELMALGDLDGFVADETEQTNALGDEIAGVLDIDVGI